MIPDLKQQVSELENQKLDLENRLQEQTVKLKGKIPVWSLVLQLFKMNMMNSLYFEFLKAEEILRDNFIALLLTFLLVKYKKHNKKCVV